MRHTPPDLDWKGFTFLVVLVVAYLTALSLIAARFQ